MLHLVQTLHGYDQGHRLLASSQGAVLDARELALLERLSDLSGYLPMGAGFDHYHTGFPCGRYHAFACTWPDLTATRAGTVLTHTLLLPRDEAGRLDDLWRLAPLHRCPRGASDREPYRQPLSTAEPTLPPREQPHPDEVLAVVALLFGTSERPLLWVDERQPDAIARLIWELLRTEQREQFAFCTFALQFRTREEGRPFDFLGIPPAARGSFLEQANSEAWWDSGRLLNPRLASLTQQPWAAEFARDGVTTLRRLETFCHENGLDIPAAKDIPTLWRFLSLEPAASERLAAARARADLFEKLWPGLDASHPSTHQVLGNLLDRQADAAFEPRPLWELTDFLGRPLVRKRLDADKEFTREVEQVLTRELARRFERVPEQTLRALPELLTASGTRWSNTLLDVVKNTLSASPEAAIRLGPPLLLTAAEMNWTELVETGLASLPPHGRRTAAQHALSPLPAPAGEKLLPLLEEAAVRMNDFGLYLFLGTLRGSELESLRTLIARLERTQEIRPQVMSSLLSEVASSTRLSWALEISAPRHLTWFAAEAGAEAARELGLGPNELVRQCDGTPNGARLLLVFAEKAHRIEPFVQALLQTPGLAMNLIVLSLREDGPHIKRLTQVAASLIPPEQLLAPELRQALLDTRDRWRVRDLMGRLGPQWIRALCEGTQPPNVLAQWLDIPMLRQWLSQGMRGQLLSATSTSDERSLISGLAATLRAWLDTSQAYDRDWIPGLLEYLVWNASVQELDPACENLAHVLRGLPPRSLDDHLASKLLALMERTRPSSGWHIVELVFARIHARLLEDAKSLFSALASLLTGKDWDRAKQLRQWLVDTYVSRDWPPESFLRSLDGDTALFFRLARRAARTPAGMDFLSRLPSALDAAPELAPRWRRPIEAVLADPHRPVDFE
ncbi:hypothetical protein [Archangium violaceum]|uniref:Uncharacterized protein n=1 Tax=Archangium violaceum Cb vi76 TaxID=1406225 RepID=A0A084SX19_9BACT|nr:hypothetical protein [Archangium violaceum]KFA93004.1 hypothetical protein Q664_12035 [Archangium violaceum Cb vi76]